MVYKVEVKKEASEYWVGKVKKAVKPVKMDMVDGVGKAYAELKYQQKDEPKGLRYDAGKIRWDLVPHDAQLEIARIYTRGAEKYSDRNWEEGMNYGKCVRALESHLNKWKAGNTFDDELEDCRHLAMVAWNAMALLSYELRGIGNDDRVKTAKFDGENKQ